jgi:surface antigen
MRIVFLVIGKINPDSLNGVGPAAQWMAATRAEQGYQVELWACSID